MSQKLENFGKHILLERLASGGMAEVFLARSTGVGGLVKFLAIKRILPQYSDSPEFIKMFIEEAKIIINLSHRNIVGMYEFGKEENRLFLTMDYIEGTNLRQITKRIAETKVKIPMEHVTYIGKEVAAGLDYAHRSLDGVTGRPLNIIHRDISPQNIMINFEGEIKIVDFGIAKAANQMDQTMSGTLKGKFSYMSKEQANGEQVDHRTDIFSLGIVLWELLANKRLFYGKDQITILKAVQKSQIPRISQINPFIPPKLEQIVMKALSPNPKTRYQRADILYKDLSKFLNHKFPDFSHHDFSDFLKGIFSKDIEIVKKKLIQFANLPLEGREEEDNLLFYPSKKKENQEKSSVSKEDQKSSSESSFFTSVTENTNPSTEKQKKKENFNQDLDENSMSLIEDSDQTRKVNLSSLSSKAKLSSSSLKSIDQKKDSSVTSTKSVFEIEDATKAKEKNSTQSENQIEEKKRNVSSAPQKNPLGSQNPASYSSYKKVSNLSSMEQAGDSSYNTVSTLSPIGKTGDSSAHSLVPILFIGFLILSAYLAFHPNKEIREKFKQNVLGVFSSKENALPSMEDEQRSLSSQEVDSSSLAPHLISLVVNSQPSGARIYVDGKDVRATTPSRILVPKNKAFSISLRKEYYFTYFRKKISVQDIRSPSLNIKLRKK